MNKTGLVIALCLLSLVSSQIFAGDVLTKTVAAVHKERNQLKGKQVSIKGKVVKVNDGIMNRNFLHIQDGTGEKGSNDLTITSDQTAKIGDEITVTGTVVLDTDFGYGYKYPLLIEKSSIKTAKPK